MRLLDETIPYPNQSLTYLVEGLFTSLEMDDYERNTRRWEDLDIDVLVKIFQLLNIFELTSGVARVCSTWRMAACDPMLWRTYDLSSMKSNFIKIPLEPYVYVDVPSDKMLTRMLKIGLSQSHGNIQTLILHFNMFISDDQLTYTAERCPRLKCLVMPAWNRIKKTGICSSICIWKDLESLTMPNIGNPPYLFEEISKNCKNFSQLKIMGPFDIYFATTLTAYLPGLKILSLRCSAINEDVLMIILDGLYQLEVLNISHCVLLETTNPPSQKRILHQLDVSIVEKASKLNKFFMCMSVSCIMCQRTRNDEGMMRWYKYEKDLWKADEVKSLAI